MRAKILSLLSVLGLLAWGTVSAAQDPPPPPPPKPAEQAKPKPPAKKAKKVWTEEDVSELRRPSDRYVEAKEKAAEEAAKAEAAKKEAEAKGAAEGEEDPDLENNPTWKERYSPEAIERQVGEFDEKIEETKALIEKSRQAMLAAKDDEAYNSAKLDYETFLENLDYLQKRAASLKVELEEAKKKAEARQKAKPAEPAPAKPPTP